MTNDRRFEIENNLSSSAQSDEDNGLPKVPPLSRWDTAMDEMISEAMRNGEFDNLSGHGKPLNLSKSIFGAEYELAYGLLKNNDYTLPWIAQRREIFNEINTFRFALQENWSLYSAEYKVTIDPRARGSLEAGWRHYLNIEVINTITKLNKKIADMNLKQPREVVEILKLNLASELRRAKAEERLC